MQSESNLGSNRGIAEPRSGNRQSPRRNGTCKANRRTNREGIGVSAALAPRAEYGKRRSIARRAASGHGYHDPPQRPPLAFRCGTQAKEYGTKADGIGAGRVARDAWPVCKPFEHTNIASLWEWLIEGSARRRSAAPDRDREEQTGTDGVGIGDSGGRRIRIVKNNRKIGLPAETSWRWLTSVACDRVGKVIAPSSGRGFLFSGPCRPWSAASPPRYPAVWAP